MTQLVLDELADPVGSDRLGRGLRDFAEAVGPRDELASFVAEFRGSSPCDERHFEQLLWRQLQQLHDRDACGWNHKVSDDPQSSHFGFSLGGTAFFVVGLHPAASRIARRAPVPTLVFNLHRQFEQLRASEVFTRMRDRIRERDRKLQGSLNPMVADHGEISEARQYSGRQVESDWHAPFCPHTSSH